MAELGRGSAGAALKVCTDTTDPLFYEPTAAPAAATSASVGKGVMDKKMISGLINSISRFIHLVGCQTTRNTPFLKEFRNMMNMLKLLKPVLDELLDSEIPSDKALLKAVEELDAFANEARELLEKQPQKMSIICNVLQCGPLLNKVQISSMEICCCLKDLLELSPLASLATGVQQCIQELQCIYQDQTLELIENALRCRREDITLDRGSTMKIVESLGLTSSKEVLMECIALEKERMKTELKKRKEDTELIYQILDLIKQIRDCMARHEQFGVINGMSVPSYFCCPLSLELMLDPVILASGQTFERSFIQKWLDHGLRICPQTRQSLPHTNLVPNYTVKSLIANWCENNGICLSRSARVNNASLHLSSTNYESHTNINGFQSSVNLDSTVRSSHIAGQAVEQHRVDTLSQNGKKVDAQVDIQEIVPQAVAFEHSHEQQSYRHFRSDSVSSVNSTTELLKKSENRTVSSECTAIPSKKSPIFTPWISSTQLHSSDLRSNSDNGNHASAVRLELDVAITSSHIHNLVDDLKSQSTEAQTAAASELRYLAKDIMGNRILIANCGAIPPLISLLNSKVKATQENAVTALLNLSINDNNKISIVEAGALEPLIHVLKCGSTEAKENSAAALFSLSVLEEYRIKIGRSGAVKALVDLLGSGTLRGKKDAAAALFNLSISLENKTRIVQAGAVKHLIVLLDPDTCMVDKAVALLANLSTVPEGRVAIAQGGAIPLLVEVVETGSQRGKENAASALLQLCINNHKFSSLIIQEGAVPPLIALVQQGTPRAKEKAQQILSHFKSQREGALGKGRP